MNATDRAAFEALVDEVDLTLVRLGQPPIRENSSLTVEPDDRYWGLLCVTSRAKHAADLRFSLESDWVRVDIDDNPEALYLPLPADQSRRARKLPPCSATLARLMTSAVTVRYRRRHRKLFLTDATGEVWCRNTYYGPMADVPRGIYDGELRTFAPLFAAERG